MEVVYKNPNPAANQNSFLGIFEGKAAARKSAAEADAQAKIEAAKQQTLLMQTLAANAGYNPTAEANQAKTQQANAETKSNAWLYGTLGAVVLVVMVGLYFIMKK